MANWFIDYQSGNDTNNGQTMDTPWRTINYPLRTYPKIAAGDYVWLRRGKLQNAASDVTRGLANWGNYSGWPRASFSLAEGTWTSGSSIVSSVSPASLSGVSGAHIARYIDAPDSRTYFVTRIGGTTKLYIDRPYLGESVSGVSGAATIQQDELYDTAQAIDDSAWTIKKSDWNADTDNMPCWSGSYSYYFYLDQQAKDRFRNLFLKKLGSSNLVYWTAAKQVVMIGCLLRAKGYCTVSGMAVARLRNCVVYKATLSIDGTGGLFFMKDVAVYGNESYNAYVSGPGYMFLEGVNFGVEELTTTYGLSVGAFCTVKGKDLLFGERLTKAINLGNINEVNIGIENYQKTEDAHRRWVWFGTLTKQDADGSGSAPNQRSGGSPTVVEILSTTNAVFFLSDDLKESHTVVFTHEFLMPSGAQNYRYYVQSTVAMAATSLYLEAEYFIAGSEDGGFLTTRVYSSGSIATRTDQSDWSEYLEVTGIDPAFESKVRVTMKWNGPVGAGKALYIDPMPVIS